ncbi:fumarylacetoacetase [Cupriavidus taiwanensis]|uniref:fumarylacetoacetase n=1 Tax=Cupriavidus taiwanensis TaxID=164546 RepID=A0A7Z7JCD3_9BURK|nr:fumarylacetoacetase [Cupriavidus taiwanensis]SOZ08225.1 Fumarylacetoacetase (Fumarylacetoacetate hydrolase) [Cupriavidus taiwanensis]SOZ13016.1 Fumarylacetoacetase (Fumarylacetoacetate hydrolase) [Cupriavidus taiwanensis]SOZ41516.1 Fumarylacetoacetase (Fumarylacetoacetate hydrolase) [Cupriavidus taiwanensis]SPC20925.1 Fumarylacetoacetase (Fumarylacetoacetate hydrolase) [Cupriavidus taiwanensis]SPD55067.1 Fumarylacetoacetase (Fumarylacetoacetate hydrolase) [Cupriavidus taiwanensis]
MTAPQASWIDSANDGNTHFSLQNLPYGVFSTQGQTPRVGVAIGDQIVDLAALDQAGLMPEAARGTFAATSLNRFIALGQPVWSETRRRLTALLSGADAALRDNAALRDQALVPMSAATLHLPVEIPGYTDFYSSKEHATNVGRMFRDPDNALLPNWLEIPIGYNGRASSVVVSGTPLHRPNGQIKLPNEARPVFSACRKLDFELEMGFIVGKPSALGEPVSTADAPAHMFGMVLLNDWSARDIQQWEYVPLGPFNSKGFGTSISPWVVTMEALEPFRRDNPAQSPEPLPYLQQQGQNAYDIALEVALQPEGAAAPSTICRTNFKAMYWTMAQQLAHHTVSGCNVRVGDLMGSGTISGTTPDSYGSLLELTRNGAEPLTLADGSQRSFLQDGDAVIMTGYCQGDGYRVGFGTVSGKILPAR